jgi:hypothetical protein
MKTMLMMAMTLLGGVGCLSQERPADDQPAQAAQALEVPAADTSTDAICRSLMQRQRACGEPFIAALVEARVRADLPPGITRREQEIGREALLQEALSEWAEDSKDAAIAAVCDDIASKVTPAKDTQLRGATSECLAKQGCEAFVECAVPLNLGRWKE